MGRHKILGIQNSDCSSNKTRIQPQMTFISMSNVEKINLCTSFWRVPQFSFSVFWIPENAISANSSTDRVKSIIVDIFVLELEISTKTTSFSLLLFQKKLFLNKVYIFIPTVYNVWPMFFHNTV